MSQPRIEHIVKIIKKKKREKKNKTVNCYWWWIFYEIVMRRLHSQKRRPQSLNEYEGKKTQYLLLVLFKIKPNWKIDPYNGIQRIHMRIDKNILYPNSDRCEENKKKSLFHLYLFFFYLNRYTGFSGFNLSSFNIRAAFDAHNQGQRTHFCLIVSIE